MAVINNADCPPSDVLTAIHAVSQAQLRDLRVVSAVECPMIRCGSEQL